MTPPRLAVPITGGTVLVAEWRGGPRSVDLRLLERAVPIAGGTVLVAEWRGGPRSVDARHEAPVRE